MTPEIGKHGFDGSCAPGRRSSSARWETFSVGIFEWVPTATGAGIKRGHVKVRVKGSCAEPELVYARARAIAAALDAGAYVGRRNVDVRRVERG